MRSSIREDIKDFVELRLRGMNVAARAYVRLMTWKMNEAQGLPKKAMYDWDSQ